MKDISIHWFRQDLRINDNPSFELACEHEYVLPIYILDKKHEMGSATKWWLYHSIDQLDKSIDGNLAFYYGDPIEVLIDLINSYKIKNVYFSKCYEPWQLERDNKIKNYLERNGVNVTVNNSYLLWDPEEIKRSDGGFYKVFTPFYRKGCLSAPPPRLPVFNSKNFSCIGGLGIKLEELGLIEHNITWHKKFETIWNPGENSAIKNMNFFCSDPIFNYKDGRNFPAKSYVSRLSTSLHFGEVSPNQVWYSALKNGTMNDKNIDHFCSELGWREFAYNQLYYNPEMQNRNLQSKFNEFPWVEDPVALQCWKKGLTGIPMVDAGMRELWQTGYIHNRSRMIVASFLTKNLMIDWRQGERWFWDCLLDADYANNSAGWQWVAGSGFDAAPYFRIFNPVLQGEKFDADGEYVRKFIPELAQLPNKNIFKPWDATAELLLKYNVILGTTYPNPIIDLKLSRERALSAFKNLQ